MATISLRGVRKSYDGKVDASDYAFYQQGLQFGSSPIPEPGFAWLLLVPLFRRRVRRMAR